MRNVGRARVRCYLARGVKVMLRIQIEHGSGGWIPGFWATKLFLAVAESAYV